MSEIRLIRQHIVKLQEEITKVKKSPTYVMSFVTNDTIPQQLQRNTVYYNLSNDEILVWNDFTNEWFMLSGGGSGVLSFVDELPDEGVENILYVDRFLLRFAIWQDDDWDFFSSGSSLTFTDLVAMLQEGTNVTLDVDSVNETITINSTVTPTVTYIRRSDYISADRISYLAFAPQGSQETDAVWTITKRVGSADGTIVSNVQYFNKKWTERGLL